MIAYPTIGGSGSILMIDAAIEELAAFCEKKEIV